MAEVSLSCKCGTLTGVLHDCDASSGSRVVCYCKDCQAGAGALDASDVLMSRGGAELFQTIPARLEITQGGDKLACLRLSPKGLMRWYASCCDTPMFNTMGSPKLRFVGVLVPAIKPDDRDHLGPVISIANTGGAAPGAEPLKDRGLLRAVFNILARHFGAILRGSNSTPFFGQDGAAVVAPKVLSLAERQAVTPDHSAG